MSANLAAVAGRRAFVVGAMASWVSGPAHAQHTPRHLALVLEGMTGLPRVRVTSIDITIDGVDVLSAGTLLDSPHFLVAPGLRDIEATVRCDLEGVVRPIGGPYRRRVLAHHTRLVLQLAWPRVGRIGGLILRDLPEDGDCQRVGESDCSSGDRGFRLRVRVE